jgi:hypothetical protein
MSLIGGAYLCWKADTYEEKIRAVELALEYSLYALFAFVGIEGVNDIIGRFKNKGIQKPTSESVDNENTNVA